MAAQIRIGERLIETGNPPFIIAEAGINHNGELAKALSMIRLAKISGADAIKFQTFKAAEFVSGPNQVYTYKSQGETVTELILEMFQRYEFSGDDWERLKDAVIKRIYTRISSISRLFGTIKSQVLSTHPLSCQTQFPI